MLEEGLKNGTFIRKQKPGKNRSDIWLKFQLIFSTDGEEVDHFYFCTDCEHVLENISTDGNINKLKRHICQDDDVNADPNKKRKLLGSKSDKKNLKKGAINFVAKDFRPYSAIECEGLIDLCTACMEFGQNNRRATQADLMNALPSRNTVKEGVNTQAHAKKKVIADLMKQACDCGGLAATTDTWTDDYRHNTYIAVVAHMCIKKKNEIQYHRFILCTNEISEVVKSGMWRISLMMIHPILICINSYNVNK